MLQAKEWSIHNQFPRRAEVCQEAGALHFRFQTDQYTSVYVESMAYPCAENSVYRFTAALSLDKLSHRLVVNWHDEAGIRYRRYVAPEESITSPKGVCKVSFVLFIQGKQSGSALFQGVEMDLLGAYQSKMVTLGALHALPRMSGGKEALPLLLQEYERRLDEIAQEKPDVVVLMEHFHNAVMEPLAPEDKFITLDSAPVRMLRQKAKQHHLYIGCSIHRVAEGNYYNTALLIDRAGEICGMYDKTHLTYMEHEMGLTPGKDTPVFDTDFGKVAFMICWDGRFPCLWQILYQKGAQIILNPSAGGIGDCISSAASCYLTGTYLVASNGKDRTRIVNPRGEVIADSKDGNYAIQTIDLHEPEWFHQLSVGSKKYGEARNIYLHEGRPDLYQTQL